MNIIRGVNIIRGMNIIRGVDITRPSNRDPSPSATRFAHFAVAAVAPFACCLS